MGIAFDGAEISRPVHEPFAHRPWKRHVDEDRVDHSFTVGMVIAAGVTAIQRALTMLPVGRQREVMHREANAPSRRIQPVVRVGQGAGNDR